LSRRRLLAGDVVFEKVGMLQAGKLDGEAVFEVAHHAALHLAQGHQRPDRRPFPRGDAGAGLRHVDDAAGKIDAVRQDQAADRIARHDTAMTAVFRQAQNMPVGEPGELRRELVAFARGGRNGHREAVLKDAGNLTLEPPEMIDMYRVTCEARGVTPYSVTEEDIAALRAEMKRLSHLWNETAPGASLTLRFEHQN